MPRYKPYPIEVVSELQDLLHDRETGSQRADRDRRERRIALLLGKLSACRSARDGDVVAGARLEAPIGSGEFGQVWRAVRQDDGKPCAVKVFHSHRLGQGRMMREFRQGVAAMRALSRFDPPPSIVSLWDADDAQLAFSMTLVQGTDLRSLPERGWSIPKKLDVFRALCEAVQFAHSHQVIHRDLKPANVVMDEHSRPVLTDFDLADLLTLGTLTGRSAGSLAYAAPEQVDAKLGAKHGHRLLESDIYSLGRILLFLITEQEPSVLNRSTDLPELAAYPRLREITGRCTRDDPAERYASVRDLLLDLKEAKTGSEPAPPVEPAPAHELATIPAREPSTPTSGLKHPMLVGLTVAGITAGGAIVAAVIARPAALPSGSAPSASSPAMIQPSTKAQVAPAPLPTVVPSALPSSAGPSPLKSSAQSLSNAASQRRAAWLERGVGAHSTPGEVRPLYESSLAMEPDEFQIGSFRCHVVFDAKGNPCRVEACEGMGPARTAVPLTLTIRCTEADDRSSVNCWSDKFNYSTGAKKKIGRLSLTLGLK